MRSLRLLVPCVALTAAVACVIGPKQDDPLALGTGDGGVGSDGGGFFEDAAGPSNPFDGAGSASDAASPTDTRTTDGTDGGGDAGDTKGDAAACDGGAPLTAIGPWDATAKCWKPDVQVFECVSALDGGAAFTCFARISTGELFLAPTAQLPSGSDYRACNEAERAATASLDRCK